MNALVNLANLESLDLSDCHAINTDQIAEILEKHREIRVLKLDNVNISDRVSKAIVNFEDLDELSVKGWNITHDQIIEILGKHTGIKRLHLSTSRTGQDQDQDVVNAIVNLDNLYYLDIIHCGFSDDKVAAILKKHAQYEA